MIINERIPLRYIFSLIRKEIIYASIIAGILAVADEYINPVLGLEFPLMPLTIPSLLGTTITLVLAFRMGQSYDRWWEARKVWGGIVNDSRALIREVSALAVLGKEKESLEFRDNIVKLNIAWTYALAATLRGLDLYTYGNKHLEELDIDELKSFDNNIPNAILHKMMLHVQKAYQTGIITEYQSIKITKTINSLGDCMGKAERINTTVFPQLYSMMIDFSIWAFVVIMPLAFRDPNKYLEFPIVMVIVTVFFTLENVAKDLQNPFEDHPTDIPVFAISRNIEIFGAKVIGEKDIPEPVKPADFYLM